MISLGLTRLVERHLPFLHLLKGLRGHVPQRLSRDHGAVLGVSLIGYEVLLDLHRVNRVFVFMQSADVVDRRDVLQKVLIPLRILRDVGEGLIYLRRLILL